MPAHPRYPIPPVQMMVLARAARAEGLTFDEFWERAFRPGRAVVNTATRPRPVGCVLWPSDSVEAKSWREATLEVKDGWMCAYDRLPIRPREQALRLLAPLLAVIGPSMDTVGAEAAA